MKHRIIIPALSVLLVGFAVAQGAGTNKVTVVWDYPNDPTVTFNAYASTNAITADNIESAELRFTGITNHSQTFTNLGDGHWSFAVEAQRDNISSALTSNTVLNVTLPLQVPAPVSNVRARKP